MISSNSTGMKKPSATCKKLSDEAFTLTLPGKVLNVSTLVNEDKKYRHRGNRDGALKAMHKLQDDDLGVLKEKKNKGTVKVMYRLFISYKIHSCVYNLLDLGIPQN